MKQATKQSKRYGWLALLVSGGLLVSVGIGSFWLDNQVRTAFRNFVAFAQDVYSPSPPPPPPPPPGGEYCGDGICNAGETSSSCPQDCGFGGSCPDGTCQASEDCPADCAGGTCYACGGTGSSLCCDNGTCADTGNGLGCWDGSLPPGVGSCSSVADCGGVSCECPPNGDWSCTLECGGGGCYSSCADTGGGGGGPPGCTDTSPDIPTLSSPTDGSVEFSPSITFDWNPIGWGTDCPPPDDPDAYFVYVDQNNPPATPMCSTSPGTTNCTMNNDAAHEWWFRPGKTYYWRVTATNGVRTSTSTTWSYTMGGEISGTVYEDTTPGVCSIDNPLDGANWTVQCKKSDWLNLVNASENGSAFTCVDSSGNTALPAGDYNLQTALTGSWQNSCSSPYSLAETVTLDQSTPNVQGYNIMVTQARDAWFQVQGGELHADSASGGVTVQSEIPDTCTPLQGCTPVLVKPGDSGQAGVVSRASGTQEFGSGSVSADRWKARAGSYKGLRADYAFWRRHLGDELVSQEITAMPGGSGFWLATNLTTLRIGSWTVSAGEKKVILYDGNVEVNGNVDVASGGSLMIVASGNITFAPTINYAEGIYVANSSIITASGGGNNDNPFTGEGTFIGWNSISLNRDLGMNNNTQPAELFVYRPDIVYNLPTQTKKPFYTWREKVNP